MARSARRTAPRHLAPYAFVAPALAVFTVVIAIPVGYTVYLSLQKTHVTGLGLGAGARTQVFAGLSNYTSGLSDPAFLASIAMMLLRRMGQTEADPPQCQGQPVELGLEGGGLQIGVFQGVDRLTP